VGAWATPFFTRRSIRQDSQSGSWKGGSWKMKISTYHSNAMMLKEIQRVLHQQHLQDLQKLNRQEDYRQKVQDIKSHWVKPNSVDVYA